MNGARSYAQRVVQPLESLRVLVPEELNGRARVQQVLHSIVVDEPVRRMMAEGHVSNARLSRKRVRDVSDDQFLRVLIVKTRRHQRGVESA